jgi:hypothetical protein
MATSAERQRKFKQGMKDKGLVQCNVWITRQACAELQVAAELIAGNPDLRLVSFTLQDAKTGRMRVSGPDSHQVSPKG